MEDEPENQSDPSSLPQPAPSEEPAITPSITPVTPPSVTPASPPISSVNSAAKKGGHKGKLIMLIILVLIVIGAIVGYRLHSDNQQTNSGKKDIPYLTYGFVNTGDITPNPLNAENSTFVVQIDSQLFEGLTRYQDQIKVAPDLATSWSNPNNTTWVFNLRHGVKFHSGRTMTAADVKYSLDYAVANQSEDNNSTLLAYASSINQVTVNNPYQVTITTNGPDAVLLEQLANLYIVDSKAKPGGYNSGTGPYTVKPGSANPNATTLDLVASNNYWGGHVYTREVQFQEVPTDNQLISDTKAGKLDVAGDFTAQQAAAMKAKINYRPITVPDLGISYLQLNLEKAGSPLSSQAARQAATYALNAPAIAKAGGLDASPVDQVIPQTLPGYDPSIKATPYDPAKAKQLLATVPNASAPLSLFYLSGDDGQVEEIAKELNAVGFNVKATAESDSNAFFSEVAAGQGDMFYLSYTTGTLDGLDMINNVVAGTQNYTSPELTSLINQASSTIDPSSRIAILQNIEQLVAKDIPVIALYTQIRTYTVTKPYVINANIPGAYTGTYFYQVYQK